MDTTAGQVEMIPSSSASSSADQTSTAGALASFNAADSSDISSPALPVTQDQDAGLLNAFRASLNDEPWSRSLSIDHSTSDPPTPTSAVGSVNGDAHAQVPLFTIVLALLGYGATVIVAVIADSKDTVSTLRTVAKVLYGITAVLAIASLAVGIMAAGCHAAAQVAGNSNNLRVSAFCARLGAILSTVLLVVVLCCKLGQWGCATGVPSAAVVAAIMAVVWIYAGMSAPPYRLSLVAGGASRICAAARHQPGIWSFQAEKEMATVSNAIMKGQLHSLHLESSKSSIEDGDV